MNLEVQNRVIRYQTDCQVYSYRWVRVLELYRRLPWTGARLSEYENISLNCWKLAQQYITLYYIKWQNCINNILYLISYLSHSRDINTLFVIESFRIRTVSMITGKKFTIENFFWNHTFNECRSLEFLQIKILKGNFLYLKKGRLN
jgi:hypothetical protein